jgi:hypothetical protein
VPGFAAAAFAAFSISASTVSAPAAALRSALLSCSAWRKASRLLQSAPAAPL